MDDIFNIEEQDGKVGNEVGFIFTTTNIYLQSRA